MQLKTCLSHFLFHFEMDRYFIFYFENFYNVCAFDVAYVTWFEPNLFQHIIPVPLKNFHPDLFSMLHALFYRTLTFYLHFRLGFGFPAFCYIEWRFYGVWCVNQKHWTTAYDNKASEIAPWLVLKFEVRPKLAWEGGQWPKKKPPGCLELCEHFFRTFLINADHKLSWWLKCARIISIKSGKVSFFGQNACVCQITNHNLQNYMHAHSHINRQTQHHTTLFNTPFVRHPLCVSTKPCGVFSAVTCQKRGVCARVTRARLLAHQFLLQTEIPRWPSFLHFLRNNQLDELLSSYGARPGHSSFPPPFWARAPQPNSRVQKFITARFW